MHLTTDRYGRVGTHPLRRHEKTGSDHSLLARTLATPRQSIWQVAPSAGDCAYSPSLGGRKIATLLLALRTLALTDICVERGPFLSRGLKEHRK